jgi:anthranilate phosphoribosyltransferase
LLRNLGTLTFCNTQGLSKPVQESLYLLSVPSSEGLLKVKRIFSKRGLGKWKLVKGSEGDKK